MPHKCTKCESLFKDGAAIILNGCPKCGWNKFLYVRDERTAEKIETPPGSIPPAASKFIKEVDDILGNKPAPSKPELKETKVETKPDEIGSRVESVRILSPGSYELNLESLLEREEIVMALKEDGTYIVHLPSVFQKKKHH
ncbi:MAG TPA: Zn-ribbon domain-containing protein [Candidatus Methanoperedens sp.]